MGYTRPSARPGRPSARVGNRPSSLSLHTPAIDVRLSYRGVDVVATLERVARLHGRPKRIRVDNGPEFISKELDLWAYLHDVELDFSRPGKPNGQRLRGIVQWQVPGRVPQRLLVPEPRQRTIQVQRTADGI